MPRTLQVYACAACHLPIHAEDASVLSLPRCGCDDVRTVVKETVNPYAGPTFAQGITLGVLAIAALIARRSEPRVYPHLLENALARSVPIPDRAESYAVNMLTLGRGHGTVEQ